MSPKAPADPSLPPPWLDFLEELDQLLPQTVELHCLGGFVLAALYGWPRPTGDLDCIAVVPSTAVSIVCSLAGSDSALTKKHRLHFQLVTVADVPEEYASRLQEMLPGRFQKLRLLSLEPHDLVLSKLTRNSPVDDADVLFLVKKGLLNPATLKGRYEQELRPNLSNVSRHDTTMNLWLEYFTPADAAPAD